MELCIKNLCLIVIDPHNLTNNFQTLDITVNKPAKSFISNKYNVWFVEQVSKQLLKGTQPADVKIPLGLTEFKPVHVKWIVDVYGYLHNQPEIIINGFRAEKPEFWLIVRSICTTNSRTVNHDIFKKVIQCYTTAENVLFITPLRLTPDVLNHVMLQISLVPSLRLKIYRRYFSTARED